MNSGFENLSLVVVGLVREDWMDIEKGTKMLYNK